MCIMYFHINVKPLMNIWIKQALQVRHLSKGEKNCFTTRAEIGKKIASRPGKGSGCVG